MESAITSWIMQVTTISADLQRLLWQVDTLYLVKFGHLVTKLECKKENQSLQAILSGMVTLSNS